MEVVKRLKVSKKDEDWQLINNDSKLLGKPNIKDNDGLMIANYRGIGLSDMIQNINNHRAPRCNIDLSLHVLEIMEGILTAAENKKIYNLESNCNQPQILTEEEIKKLIII